MMILVLKAVVVHRFILHLVIFLGTGLLAKYLFLNYVSSSFCILTLFLRPHCGPFSDT